jgi:hypothetical protein
MLEKRVGSVYVERPKSMILTALKSSVMTIFHNLRSLWISWRCYWRARHPSVIYLKKVLAKLGSKEPYSMMW